MENYNFMFMDYAKVEDSLSKLGISIKTENGEFRSLNDVLEDIAKKFNEVKKNEAC